VTGGGGGGVAFQLRLLELVSVILEPDLDLQRAETQRTCQLVSLGRRQVALLGEPSLERASLSRAEQHASLASPTRTDAHSVTPGRRCRLDSAVIGSERVVVIKPQT